MIPSRTIKPVDDVRLATGANSVRARSMVTWMTFERLEKRTCCERWCTRTGYSPPLKEARAAGWRTKGR
jgi:hypothetical protein